MFLATDNKNKWLPSVIRSPFRYRRHPKLSIEDSSNEHNLLERVFLLQSNFLFVRFYFVFLVSVGYSDYTDAYSRSEIEMMKNFDPTLSHPGTGTFTTNMVESEDLAGRTKEPPHNWYLLYLSGKTCLSQKYLLFCFGFIDQTNHPLSHHPHLSSSQ